MRTRTFDALRTSGRTSRRRSLGRLAAAAVALITVTATLAPTATAKPHPDQQASNGRLSATIRYTEYGIPHILAKDYAGLGFGNGWAQAEDQVCVLADGFVTVRGERSRHFGAEGKTDGSLSSASDNLASDLYFRGVRDSKTVEKLQKVPEPRGTSREVKEMMRGWAAGYNAWLKQNPITDPACKGADWVRPVRTIDVAARGYAVAVLGGQGRGVDGITAAQPPGAASEGRGGRQPADPGEAARELFSTEDADMGSNAVAFGGETTANGRGLLLGNPHYPWQGGRRFWQSQQTIPGELNVAGGSLLGTTNISIGHNAHVAWSHTVATGVTMNLHQLSLDPADPTTYLVDGEPEKMTERTVTVPVKGGEDVTRTQWWTRYGPVVNGLGSELPLPWTADTAYALNDPNATNMRASQTALGFSKARSTAGVERALDETQGLPWVNTIAADSRGHSLFAQHQVLPRITDELAERCSTPLGEVTYPSSGLAVLDGSRTDCALGSDKDALQPGILGPDRMPVLRDAPYAENSNDSAWLANADLPLTGYERVFGDQGTERTLRTRGAAGDVSALADRGRLTVRDLQHQQFANRVPAGDLAAADVARACAELPGGEARGSDGKAVDVRPACAVIAQWDRTMNTDSRGALLYDRFWRSLAASVPEAERWKVPFSADDPVGTPHTLNTSAPGFATSLADAVTELEAAGIDLVARLGDHQSVPRGGERVPVGGGTESLGVWNKSEPVWDPSGGGYTDVEHGSSYIQAVGWDGGRCPVARTLLTYSQSQNPRSPHSADQTRLYSDERWVKSRFCEKDILRSPELRVARVRER
ncbi:Aculeacin-A acylase precursor [Streptomyces sp. YIM 130001]|uniref:penicillin acylase family protein n=1 Tax=Streptomyces sp. YIM 130001 TaxID=2259644 RepID=UPI000E64D9DA|nr:penicillin acylase family protein [Streptomyces sp. YIM 130001]RII14631.1 Aculeacin-A acylase precursor [Streptomyces sp. YIM 130001]